MLLAIIAYLGGVLTILSPCILPVLPCLCAGRSTVRQDGSAAARRNGADLRRGCDASSAGWRLGGACQRDWSRRRACSARHLWRGAAPPVDRRSADAPDCEPWQQALAILDGGSEQRAENLLVVRAWHLHRPALGALRRADPRPCPRRRRCGVPMPKPRFCCWPMPRARQPRSLLLFSSAGASLRR